MSVVRRQSAEVFADYKQFYVQDAGIDPPAPEDWTDDDIANRSKVAENVVVVCLRISHHRGHPFHGIADSVSA